MSSGKPLSKAQIKVMEQQGCRCTDWGAVTARDGFDPRRVINTAFVGEVSLGEFGMDVEVRPGLEVPSGITGATIAGCYIGDNVLIHNVGLLANCEIGDAAVIVNTSEIHYEPGSTCGDGTVAETINEAGGRQIMLYERLTAQVAYIMAMHRHDKAMIERLESLIGKFVADVAAEKGRIGAASRVFNCTRLSNVRTGPGAVIEGASLLENVTVKSDMADPAFIGASVIMRDCIVCEGARVSGGAVLSNCFVGQAAEIASQFSATNSLFFANSSCYNGEACSIFAGPFTVSHHKSSLLLTAMYSFFNAGSGTNQSNHMYKLGPCHQGILERGTRTASDAYILWPARVGAFSLVKGRHTRNFDTSDLPFSYILESDGESMLVPAGALRNVGIVRNEANWHKRDKRKAAQKLDLINSAVFNARTAEKMMRALAILRPIVQDSGGEIIGLCGLKTRRASLPKAIGLYEWAVDAYLGGVLAGKLERDFPRSSAELGGIFSLSEPAGNWLDVAGMIAPADAVATIEDDIREGRIESEAKLRERFASLHEDYRQLEWQWVSSILRKRLEAVGTVCPNSVGSLLHKWHASVKHLNDARLADADKEFNSQAMVGYGADGDEACRQADFEAVRGDGNSHPFVVALKEDSVSAEGRAQRLCDMLAGLG